MPSLTHHLIALFHDEAQARDALQALVKASFPYEDISVVTRQQDEEDGLMRDAQGGDVVESSLHGAGAGMALGSLGALAVGMAAFAIPGLGLGLGPVALAMLGGGLGATSGGIAGALSRFNTSRDEDTVRKHLEEGSTLLAITGEESRRKEAHRILETYRPHLLHTLILSEEHNTQVLHRKAQDPDNFFRTPASTHEPRRASELRDHRHGLARTARHRRMSHRELEDRR